MAKLFKEVSKKRGVNRLIKKGKLKIDCSWGYEDKQGKKYS